MIEQELRDDPYAQEAFSKLLRQAIEEAEKLFDHPLKQYMLFREFEEQVQDRRLNDIPDAFAGNRHAQAYFGVFKKVLPEALAVLDQQVQDKWIKVAFEIDLAVETSVAENSINHKTSKPTFVKSYCRVCSRSAKPLVAEWIRPRRLLR